MPAIEHRNRKEIQEPDTDRKDGRELGQGQAASPFRNVFRHLDDTGRTAELIGAFPADKDTPDILQGAFDDGPCFLNGFNKRSRR